MIGSGTSRENLLWTIEYPSGQLRVSEAFSAWIGKSLDSLEELLAQLEPLSADRLRIWLEENEEDPEPGEVPLAFKDLHPSLYIGQLEPVYHQGRMVSVQVQITPVLTMLQENPIAETHRIQTLYHQGSMGIVITDPLDRIRDCNPVFCQMLGQDQQSLLGDKILDHIHPADRARQLTLFDQMRYGDAETVHVEKRYLRADGTYFWAEVALTLIRNAAGEISHFLRLILDLSERKHAHEELGQRQLRIESLYRQAPLMLGIIELETTGQHQDFRFILVNPAMETYAAPANTQLEGRSALEAGIPETMRVFFLTQLQLCLNEQRSVDSHYRGLNAEGKPYELHCLFFPVAENSGQSGQCYFLIQDLIAAS